MNKNTIKKIIASGLIIAIIAAGTEIADKSSQVAGTTPLLGQKRLLDQLQILKRKDPQ